MKLIELRSDAPKEKFPVYASNSGRSHQDADRVAGQLSREWRVLLSYAPDTDGGNQGTFYLDARKCSDLEVEGLNPIIHRELRRYPKVYDLECP